MPGSGLGQRRPRRTTEHFQSSETSNTIPAGCPVCFTMSGMDDGGLVELPSSADSIAVGTSLLAGVSVKAVAPGTQGEFVVNGYVKELRVIRGVRAASTDSYASSPAIAIGDIAYLETVANGVSRAAAAASNSGYHAFILAETAASSASAASTTSDTSTSRIDTLKAFVRLM